MYMRCLMIEVLERMTEALGPQNDNLLHWWITRVSEDVTPHIARGVGGCITEAVSTCFPSIEKNTKKQKCSCFSQLFSTSQGSSSWARYYLTMKTMQLNPLGFILFLFSPERFRMTFTHPLQQGLISREILLHQRRQMNFNYCRSCSSCTRTFQSANSRGTNYYVNADYVQSWYLVPKLWPSHFPEVYTAIIPHKKCITEDNTSQPEGGIYYV